MQSNQGTGARRERVIVVNGVRWVVYEVIASLDRRGSSLIFDSGEVVRRLRDYPSAWHELDQAALVELMNQPPKKR